MRRALPLAAAFVVLVVAAYRASVGVRVIRALDRRGGLATKRGEQAYARVAAVFPAVHDRAAREAAAAAPTGVIADVGAGPGDVVARIRGLAPGATVVGIEPSAGMRAMAASRGIALLEGVAEALPLEDASADVLVSTFSAHHWNDPVAAFREVARVLRPGAQAMIYDVRFAAFSLAEARAIARAAGIDATAVRRDILPERRLGLRLYCRITITHEEHHHAG